MSGYGKSATVKFDGAADNGDNNVLQLTRETDVATGVGIQLSDISNNVLPLYGLNGLSAGFRQRVTILILPRVIFPRLQM